MIIQHPQNTLNCILQAQRALDRGEVPVGCLLVYEDQVIGTGGNAVNETKNVSLLSH